MTSQSLQKNLESCWRSSWPVRARFPRRSHRSSTRWRKSYPRKSPLLVEKLKNRISGQSSKFLELRSVSSCHSSHYLSVLKTSNTIARLQALADAKAAKEEAQYTPLIAQKGLECRTRNAQAERISQREIAQFESETAKPSLQARATYSFNPVQRYDLKPANRLSQS